MLPVDLFDVLERTWQTICSTYDVTADLPDIETLFEGADLALPDRASEALVANMLSEAIECIGRFSPWYKKPAQAFGLKMSHDRQTNAVQWQLSPDAIRQQGALLKPLTVAIRKNTGLIQAAQLVSSLVQTTDDDPCVTAQCLCVPPRVILVNRSILVGAEIICDTCHQPFQHTGDMPDADGWIN